jgi:RNA polymerase sigma-70 factor (ECF subfamily)
MDERRIIRACQENDFGAFEMIYQKYEQPLLRTALRMVKQQQDAEDAVQTAFLKLYKNIRRFQYKSKFSTYLFRILINTCYDIINSKKRTETVPIEDSDKPYFSSHELCLSLEKAVEKLPHQMRACFVLFAVEEFKQKDIAKILGISIGGVKSNIFHAKCRLREMLSDSLQEKQK